MRKQNTTTCTTCRFGQYIPNAFGFRYGCRHPKRDDKVLCPIDKYEIDIVYEPLNEETTI